MNKALIPKIILIDSNCKQLWPDGVTGDYALYTLQLGGLGALQTIYVTGPPELPNTWVLIGAVAMSWNEFSFLHPETIQELIRIHGVMAQEIFEKHQAIPIFEMEIDLVSTSNTSLLDTPVEGHA